MFHLTTFQMMIYLPFSVELVATTVERQDTLRENAEVRRKEKVKAKDNLFSGHHQAKVKAKKARKVKEKDSKDRATTVESLVTQLVTAGTRVKEKEIKRE